MIILSTEIEKKYEREKGSCMLIYRIRAKYDDITDDITDDIIVSRTDNRQHILKDRRIGGSIGSEPSMMTSL